MSSFGNSARGRNKGKVPASLELPRELTRRLRDWESELSKREKTSLSECGDTKSQLRFSESVEAYPFDI